MLGTGLEFSLPTRPGNRSGIGDAWCAGDSKMISVRVMNHEYVDHFASSSKMNDLIHFGGGDHSEGGGYLQTVVRTTTWSVVSRAPWFNSRVYLVPWLLVPEMTINFSRFDIPPGEGIRGYLLSTYVCSGCLWIFRTLKWLATSEVDYVLLMYLCINMYTTHTIPYNTHTNLQYVLNFFELLQYCLEILFNKSLTLR